MELATAPNELCVKTGFDDYSVAGDYVLDPTAM